MATSLTLEGRRLARKVLFYQTIFALVLSSLFAFFLGVNSGISAALGGITSLIPALIFAHFAFKYAGASKNKLVVQSFNRGNKLKFVMTIVLFALAMQWSEIAFLPLIVTYLLTTVAQWPLIGFLHRAN